MTHLVAGDPATAVARASTATIDDRFDDGQFDIRVTGWGRVLVFVQEHRVTERAGQADVHIAHAVAHP